MVTEKLLELEKFKPSEWEKVICVEIGEKAICDNCKTISSCEVIGQQIQCSNPRCQKYLWRKKGNKL
jgi:hypothetical protein